MQEIVLSKNQIAQHDEVITSLEPHVANMLDDTRHPYLIPTTTLWQPSRFLPDSQSENFLQTVQELRENAQRASDAVVVVLVGDTVTEEALPSYQTWLNRVSPVRDKSGVDESAWGRWSRGWTAEENRHGDILSEYLYLSGRVNMEAVHKTIHSLIANGFDPQIGDDAYEAFVYTAFQERATRISHGNVKVLAKQQGIPELVRGCGAVEGDEARHERFYTDVMSAIFDTDPEGAILAFASMLQKKVVMPAALMTDGEKMKQAEEESPLFIDFSNVAQSIGVYTALDYVNIIQHLRKVWNVDDLDVSGVAAEAQEFIGSFTQRRGELLDKSMNRRFGKNPNPSFKWINNDSISLKDPGPSLRNTS